MRRSNPLDLFSGSVADIRGFIPPFRTKQTLVVFRPPEAKLGSHVSVSSGTATPEQMISVQQDWNWTRSSAGRVATSAVRREAEREEGQRRGPGPRLSLQGLLSTNCINTIRRSAASCLRPSRRENRRRGNNRRRRRAASEGSGRAGRHASGTRANPGAFWNRTEGNRFVKECGQNHGGSTLGPRKHWHRK